MRHKVGRWNEERRCMCVGFPPADVLMSKHRMENRKIIERYDGQNRRKKKS